jgi:hypothetical protein
MGAPYLVSEPTRQQLEQLIEDRRVDAGAAGGTWAVRQVAASVSLIGTTSGTFSNAVGVSQSQSLFTGVGSGLYHLIGTFRISSPIAPSTQQYCQTRFTGTATPTPAIWGSEIIASAGSWTTDTQTISCLYTHTGSGNSISMVGNDALSTVQVMGYAFTAALIKLA